MKDVFMKYWQFALFIIFILGAPVVLNFLVFTPSCQECIGDVKDWINFWSNYLSAIISAMIAFAILVIQRKDNKSENCQNRDNNHTENEKNRQLQLNVLVYQQQSQWLNNLREAIVNNIIVYETNNLREIINLFKTANLSLIQQKIKDTLERLTYTDTKVAMIMPEISSQNKYLSDYNNKRREVYDEYCTVIRDLQVLSVVYSLQLSIKDIDDSLLSIASTSLKTILGVCKPDEKLTYNQVYDISNKRLSPSYALFEEIRKCALICIGNEQKRIDSILIREEQNDNSNSNETL